MEAAMLANKSGSITGNLFKGHGEGTWELEVTEGVWPSDAKGNVFIVGPDKRQPGGHWFGEWGLLHRFRMEPADGRIRADAKRVSTPVEKLSQKFPKLFRKFQFAEVSPFGVSNLGNTNVQALDGRLFLGYDAGRPIEVDPETMEAITAVGANGEWQQMIPGTFEPMCPVAAHPANSPEERAMYFVNYFPVPGMPTYVARWGLNGPVERWPVEGMSDFDSIHDIKCSRDHLVFCDLPFKVEPDAMRGKAPRRIPNDQRTQLWIVSKEVLRRTPPGEPVQAVEVVLPMPTGHLMVDVDDSNGTLRVHVEHIPLADLMLTLAEGEVTHSGAAVGLDLEGMVSLGVQPGCVGTYEIDALTGEIKSFQTLWDDRFWGGVLTTYDYTTAAARERVNHVWFAGLGFHPDLVSETWWDLYSGAGDSALVDPTDLPTDARPGALCHFDVDSGKVVGVYEYPDGSFPTPPTYVPSTNSAGPNDGYIVVLVHGDERKELHIFDAQDIERGPLAKAAAPGFNPPLLLHSYWMDHRDGPRPTDYQVTKRADVAGAIKGLPAVVKGIARMGRQMKLDKAKKSSE